MTSDELWRRYWQDRSVTNRNAIFEFYWPRAKSIIQRVMAKHGCQDLVDDAVSEATERLLEDGIPGYAPSLGTFGQRLGAILRYSISETYRVRQRSRNVSALLRMTVLTSRNHLAQTLGHYPTESQIAEDIGCDERQVGMALRNGCPIPLVNITVQPDRSVDLRDELDHALRDIDLQSRTILEYYYIQGMNQAEIAAALHLNQPLVSKTLKKTLDFLRRAA